MYIGPLQKCYSQTLLKQGCSWVIKRFLCPKLSERHQADVLDSIQFEDNLG